MPKYTPEKIEKKWQKFWKEQNVFVAITGSTKPKKYVLVEFPYPSGAGLHVGHPRAYVAADVMARYYRATGYEVLYPFGFDAFGLPAENYAIKTGIQPQISTDQNIKNIRRQAMSWGLSFDWTREVITTDPNYYKWTQWIFLQFFKAGLAYEKVAPINWCPKDKTALANEEVIDGKCDRCGTLVEKKDLRQWYLQITKYAQKLIDGLDSLNWPTSIKEQQKNWIGRSEGAEITFELRSSQATESLTVFTTRPDTLFGVTYIVLAPEHPLITVLQNSIENWGPVETYITEARNKSDLQRVSIDKEKTGVVLKGIHAVNPANGTLIPVWIADYVLPNYGTGAIMAVPAHDVRDREFAENYDLPVITVVSEKGILENSGVFNDQTINDAKKNITQAYGKTSVQYKLRDWVFSRQRYWGEPIPLIHCENCGVVVVPEKDLPVVLPPVEKYEPTGTGESPLAAIPDWVNTLCPECGGHAKRETNTMPQWAGSSWYYLRYTDPTNVTEFAGFEPMEYWLPVDLYFGGTEHTTLHLLYSRFWHLFLYDQGLVPTPEPYAMRQPHGSILGPDGEKMSKSKGNVVNPDDIVNLYGADTFRLFDLFLGPHEQAVTWNDQGAIGVRRFLDRLWNFVSENIKQSKTSAIQDSEKALFALHKLIKKIEEDITNIKYNTAVAACMEFINTVSGESVSIQYLEQLVIILAPFAPHIAEELWNMLGHDTSVSFAEWPQYDPSKLQTNEITIAIQVNGKFRANVVVPINSTEQIVTEAALILPTVAAQIDGKRIVKTVFVENRLINFVV